VAVPWIVVPDAREALGLIAAAWYGFPGDAMRVVGVTGTDGKTTTASLIHAALSAGGEKVGLLTTVQARCGDRVWDTGLHTTTPDAPDLQRLLHQVREQGAHTTVVEVTSHGLAQKRVAGTEFDMAVLTNVTSEHLDFHETWEAYRLAKAQLFRELYPGKRKPDVPKVAVLNADDPNYRFFRQYPSDACWSYGITSEADVTAQAIQLHAGGVEFVANMAGGEVQVRSHLPGRFNVYNLLAALTTALACAVSPEAAADGLAGLLGIPGRMEPIEAGQPYQVLVDFAHTANSLRAALETARQMTEGRVLVVFGCAGLRDMEKRPLMGKVAGEMADLVVITAEDPRTEDLQEIMSAIAVGCLSAGCQEGRDFVRVPARDEAIRFALESAAPGDLVLIAGKGHERSMCYGTEEIPWSDGAVATEILRDLYG
jgi:UDP-N-acetylmuramoyl-L-alanyl-D-glutamate--2,6-diaminopimelate ligase